MLEPKNISRILFFVIFAASFFMLPYLIKATEEKPEDKLRLNFYKHVKDELPLEADRLAVCNCAMKKLAGVSPEKQEQDFETVKSACYRQIQGLTFGWNATLREMLREQIFQHPSFAAMDSAQKMIYLDCFIGSMKKYHPQGMSNRIPGKEMQVSCNTCYSLIAPQKLQMHR